MAFQGIKVLKDTYRDSVELMQVASGLERSFKGVRASVMMATPAFQELLSKSGVDLPAELAANDLIMHVKADSADVLNAALEKGVKLITEEKAVSAEDQIDAPKPSTIAEGSSIQGGSNLVLISVPGQYATAEAMKALKRGAHVFMFSDNVPLEDEIELKHFANERQLLLMGPDCGTALIDGVPLGFANVIRRGSIGLVGASGTGLQQVSSLIDTYGQGVSQMIGVGGRDLEDEVGGTMMLQGMQRLIHDPSTNVIVLVSKIPGTYSAHLMTTATNCQQARKSPARSTSS
jgi:FdrA protein